MEKLMALYGISSPSGREGKMAKFIIEELKRMEIPFRQDRYGCLLYTSDAADD